MPVNDHALLVTGAAGYACGVRLRQLSEEAGVPERTVLELRRCATGCWPGLRPGLGVLGRGGVEGGGNVGATSGCSGCLDVLWSEPVIGSELRVRDAGGELGALTPERRRELRAALAAGELEELTFEAVTFRAAYPNANFLRFRDEDLPGFASSFAGQPFLRNHDQWNIESRGGTVQASALAGRAFVQQVKLTVPRDIEAFLNGQIDRFSIGWNRQRA